MPEDRSKATVLAKPSYILGNDGGGLIPEMVLKISMEGILSKWI
jgi:hypothetical protein